MKKNLNILTKEEIKILCDWIAKQKENDPELKNPDLQDLSATLNFPRSKSELLTKEEIDILLNNLDLIPTDEPDYIDISSEAG